MGLDYEYRVDVTRTTISGTLDTPELKDRRFEPVTVREDDEDRRLRLDTIDVLRKWLNRWTALIRVSEQAEYAELPVRNTSTVLGQHLYATVFTGQVREGFNVARAAAAAAGAKLRLLLRFDRSAEHLAQLPWELLYADDEFLAKEHRLVLSRSLLPEGRVRTVPQEPPLKVRFLVTLPDGPAYREQRVNLLTALRQPDEYSTKIDSDILEWWSEDKAAAMLNADLPHVVHIVGVCRRLRDRQGNDVMQIYLDDGVEARWRSPLVLVNLFRDNKKLDPANRVRLVVLHLCEPSPMDFEVTFERLAPDLIECGIPTVLAMQYPLSGNAAGRFVKMLYQELAGTRTIEEAVQDARSDLFTQVEDDLLFGSPLLYMQSVDSQLLIRQGTAAGADAGPSSVSTTQAPPRSTLEWLLQQLDGIGEPAPSRGDVAKILRQLDPWPPQLTDVERRLSRQAREYAYRADLARVFLALVRVVQAQLEVRDG